MSGSGYGIVVHTRTAAFVSWEENNGGLAPALSQLSIWSTSKRKSMVWSNKTITKSIRANLPNCTGQQGVNFINYRNVPPNRKGLMVGLLGTRLRVCRGLHYIKSAKTIKYKVVKAPKYQFPIVWTSVTSHCGVNFILTAITRSCVNWVWNCSWYFLTMRSRPKGRGLLMSICQL